MSDVQISQTQLTQCPFCCEQIIAEAIKCKHCNSALIPLVENVRNGPFMAASGNVAIPLTPVASDNGDRLGALFLSISIFCLLVIISCSEGADAKDSALGALLLFGAPAVIGSVYVMSNKKSGATFSYFALACSGLSLLVTLGLFS
jgi:hypothetical protein